MSRICIITPRSINDSPCLEKYDEIISEPYDIIYWSKSNRDEKCGAENAYRYTGIVPVEGGRIKKIWHYCMLVKFAKKIVRQNHYEKLIIYPTHMAWLLRRLLRKEYKKRYVLDIRDYAGENNRLIGKLTSEVVRCSGICSITSPSFKAFLPQNVDYIISHNIQSIDQAIVNSYRRKKYDPKKPIVMSFIGTVRFIEQQKRLIEVFGKDPRFNLKFVGRGSEALKDFCNDKGFSNVELIGQFDRNQLGQYYLLTDIAINVYGNDNPALTHALSNKLYSAALMGMPIICSPNTCMESIVMKYGFGCSVDLNSPDCTDKLYDYYKTLQPKELFDNCDKFIRQVFAEEKEYRKKVVEFLGSSIH